MSIGKREKMFLHIYKQAAGLADPEYRRVLRECSGCSSSADRRFAAHHFRAAMSRLEALLWVRVDEGLAPPPDAADHIRRRDYWREQVGLAAPPARITTGQVARIENIWRQLRAPLGERWTVPYFAGVVQRATGRANVGTTALTTLEARTVIDALAAMLTRCLTT